MTQQRSLLRQGVLQLVSESPELHSRPHDLFAVLRRQPNIAPRPHLVSVTVYFTYSSGSTFSHRAIFAEDFALFVLRRPAL
jgi:hypothetical protein